GFDLTVNSLHHRLRIPGAKKNPDPPARGEGPPKPPEPRTRPLLVPALRKGVRIHPARTQPLIETMDKLPFPGAVRPGDNDNDGNSPVFQGKLRLQQLRPQGRHRL